MAAQSLAQAPSLEALAIEFYLERPAFVLQ
jgi:hypothetical protein